MKRMFMLVLVLMFCMALVMAGCSETETKPEETQKETAQQTTAATTEADEGEGDPTDAMTEAATTEALEDIGAEGVEETLEDVGGPDETMAENVNPEGDPGIEDEGGENGGIGPEVEVEAPEETEPSIPEAPELDPTEGGSGDDFEVDFGELTQG